MNKKIFLCLFLAVLLVFTSCNNKSSNKPSDTADKPSDTMDYPSREIELREKMKLLQKNFTPEQVIKVLGQPDDHPSSGTLEFEYYLNNNEVLVIAFLGNGIVVEIYNTVTYKKEVIMQ